MDKVYWTLENIRHFCELGKNQGKKNNLLHKAPLETQLCYQHNVSFVEHFSAQSVRWRLCHQRSRYSRPHSSSSNDLLHTSSLKLGRLNFALEKPLHGHMYLFVTQASGHMYLFVTLAQQGTAVIQNEKYSRLSAELCCKSPVPRHDPKVTFCCIK